MLPRSLSREEDPLSARSCSATSTQALQQSKQEKREAEMRTDEDAITLPDLLRDDLRLVFVGINPSVFSAMRGHYFARPTNRFWSAFSRSRLSRRARQTRALPC